MSIRPVSEIAISLPFSISQYGKVASTQSQEKIWADRVRSAIGTMTTERIMRPDFGSTIPMDVFSQYDASVPLIKDTVRSVFAQFLSLLTLDQVNVSLGDDYSTISIEVVYSLPNQKGSTSHTAFLNLNGTNPSTQENL